MSQNVKTKCHASQKEKRPLCRLQQSHIVDGRDEALFCEGKCQAWLHRCCASVSSEQHKLLAASTEPFLCPTCGQERNQAQIAELKNTVEALKLELSQLKKAFSDFRDQATQPTTINSTTINSKSYAAAATTDDKTRSIKRRPTVTDVRKKCNLMHQSSKRPPDSTPNAPGTVPSNNSAASNSTAQSNRARVD